MKKGKKLLGILLVLALCLTLLPLSVLAESEESSDASIEDQDYVNGSEDSLDTSTRSKISTVDNYLSDSGTCGENLTWTITSGGVLTISGTGDMTNYNSSSNRCPWLIYFDSIKYIIVESGVTSIGDYAFYTGFNYVKEITLPDTLTSIGNYALYSLSKVTELKIPDSVTSIGDYAFCGWSSLTELILPDGITTIGKNTFFGCSSLTDVTIPESVTSIEQYAFYSCNSITNVYYGGSKGEWNAISISSGNSTLTDATIHYGKDSTASLGDVNGDNSIDIKDARSLFQYVNKQLNDSDVVAEALDVDGSGSVNAKDVRTLFQYANKQIDTLG